MPDDDKSDGDDCSVDVGLVAAGAATDGVVLKVEDCAAPRRQMHNEWQVSDRSPWGEGDLVLSTVASGLSICWRRDAEACRGEPYPNRLGS